MLNEEIKAFGRHHSFVMTASRTSLLDNHTNQFPIASTRRAIFYIAMAVPGTQLALPKNHQNMYTGEKLGMAERLDKLKTDS
jgi:hypothetical protein